MGTRQITIAPQLVGPGGGTTAGRAVTDAVKELMIQVVSPDWFTTTGTLIYGADYMISGVWTQGPRFTSPYGETRRGDGVTMPSFKITADALSTISQVRLFASCSPAIHVGANVTVFF